jgi:hypothetical protein
MAATMKEGRNGNLHGYLHGGKKIENLSRRTNHQLRKSENQGTDKAPAQRVHGSNHEGLIVGARLFGVGESGAIGQRPIATGHADAVRRSA